ncbi:uncharacterized protein [Oryza sativa Japonica Group]|uniref:F-box domain containing protein, expressed n=1 Tax=Oryza sativa subsp. japonica TaxID=39947 RepID=Q2RB09_ORYSJ|nr:F-box domain containing protein, expressed [Oryza sativa Japonica Group]USI00719.1 F-box domain-containing protein [Oryza sativa Japonica Group]
MEDNVLVSSKIHGRSKSTTAKRNCIICGQRISKRRRTQHNFQKISRGQLNLQRTRPCLLNFQSLPKDIVLRVMSKLTLKEVAQLSVVSTNWRQAWTFHPNLYFGIKTALGNNAKRKGTSSDLNCRISSGNKFIKRVDAILEKHCGTMGCHLQRMELHAPNLTTFEYDGSLALVTLNECSNIKASTIRLFDEKTLQNILTGIPSVLPHVETLYVEVHVKTQMSGFTQSPLKFTQLKCLTLEITFERGSFDRNSVFQLTNLFVAAPFLEDLYLDMYCSLNRCPLDLDDIVDQPHYHLKMVCIFGFCGNTGQVELAKCILRNALILEQMIIDPKGRYRLDGYFGRQEADEKLVPEDIDGVLTIL